jgi:hypothetical protein
MPSRSVAAAVGLALAGLAALTGCSGDGDGSAEKSPRPRSAVKPAAAPVPPGALGPEFFGMHDSDPVGASWPEAPVGALRVWDSGTVWSQVETAPGSYDFTRLDEIVKTARSRDAQALIVLGQTPTFHASKPDVVGSYGAGASSMPDLDAWKAYVREVVTRYTGEDIAFQVWNEANVEGYWSGSPQDMAELTAAAREVMDEVGSTQTLVAPAMATRLLFHRAFLRDYYRQSVDGVPVADLVDVLSFQLYPEPKGSPEDAMTLLAAVKEALRVEGVDPDAKPIWNTEINYGLQGGVPAEPAAEEEQQANVARTYLLNAANGIGRVYWYSWDLATIADTLLVEAADAATPTSAGTAFATTQDWLVDHVVQSCAKAGGGVWACSLLGPEGESWVYWSTKGSAEVRTAFEAAAAQPLTGPAEALPLGGATIPVGEAPVLVTGDVAGAALPPRV